MAKIYDIVLCSECNGEKKIVGQVMKNNKIYLVAEECKRCGGRGRIGVERKTKVGDRVRIKDECVRKHGRPSSDGGEGTITLKAAIDHCTEGKYACNEKLQWLIDQGFVEVVEKFEVKVGDRYVVNDDELMLCGQECGICMVVLESDSGVGQIWDDEIHKCVDFHGITLGEFKSTLGCQNDEWRKIYATRVPHKK